MKHILCTLSITLVALSGCAQTNKKLPFKGCIAETCVSGEAKVKYKKGLMTYFRFKF